MAVSFTDLLSSPPVSQDTVKFLPKLAQKNAERTFAILATVVIHIVSISMSANPSKSRAIVDSTQLSTLASSYAAQFEKYSNGRTKVTQIIPSAVWKEVYQEYLQVYPNSTIGEKTLKERLRETLSELDTGTSNEKRSNTAVPQSEEVLKRIKLTDGHASRNVLIHRTNRIVGKPTFLSPPPSPETMSQHAQEFDPSSAAPQSGVNHPKISSEPVKKPVSKMAMLEMQVNSIASIGGTLAESAAKRNAMIELKATSASKRDQLMDIKIRREQLLELKQLLDMGLITNEEMKEKAAQLMK